MNLSELCIRRLVMTTSSRRRSSPGIFGYRLLAVAALPRVDFPTIQVTAVLPGASPETMAASVAGPIERQFSTIAGISSMTSTSSLGQTQITIQFDLKRDIDGAALDVQTALAVAQRRLPIEMTTPPSFRKVNPGDFGAVHQPVSPTLRMSRSTNTSQTTVLAQPVARVVARVRCSATEVRGGSGRPVAAARNISLDDVRTVLTKANSMRSVLCQARPQRHPARFGRDPAGFGLRPSSRHGATVPRSAPADASIVAASGTTRCGWFNGDRRRAGDPAAARCQRRRGGGLVKQKRRGSRPGAGLDPHGAFFSTARSQSGRGRGRAETLACIRPRHPASSSVPALGPATIIPALACPFRSSHLRRVYAFDLDNNADAAGVDLSV
jgi:hypothetical protein